jgi:hypothetical protein
VCSASTDVLIYVKGSSEYEQDLQSVDARQAVKSTAFWAPVSGNPPPVVEIRRLILTPARELNRA